MTSASSPDHLFESDTLEKGTVDKATQRYQLKGKYDVCFYFNGDKTERTRFNMELPMKPNIIAEDFSERSPFDPDLSSRMNCQSGRSKATIDVPVGYPVLLSAVDPAAENRLEAWAAPSPRAGCSPSGTSHGHCRARRASTGSTTPTSRRCSAITR
ncbi:hypothetical protein E4K10_03435 [Streptomyces sp. T1317-0309]|nr:hypothetical protein E4K10_03435 [Streptomyces sp. T1317-0309]